MRPPRPVRASASRTVHQIDDVEEPAAGAAGIKAGRRRWAKWVLPVPVPPMRYNVALMSEECAAGEITDIRSR